MATSVGTPSYSGGSTLMWTDSGLTNGSEYFYTAKALDGCAEGEASNEDSDIVDPDAIPWDTRDPNTILNACAALADASAPDEPIDIEDEFRMMGPDGAIYERGVSTQQQPDGIYNAATGLFTWGDGSAAAITTGHAPYDEEEIGESFNSSTGIRPFAEIGQNVRGEAYRGVLTIPGYRRCSFDITLSTDMNFAGRTAGFDDTAFVYVGSSAPGTGVDAGLMYDPNQGNVWHPYMLGSDPPFRKNAIRHKTPFAAGSRVRLAYFIQIQTRSKGTKKNVVFLKVTDTSSTGKSVTNGIVAKNHHANGLGVKMKHNQQMAQTLAIGTPGWEAGYVKTNSYMLDFNWQNGRLWERGETGSKRWSQADTKIAKSFPEPSVDSVVTTNVLSPYDWEAHVGIDLRPY